MTVVYVILGLLGVSGILVWLWPNQAGAVADVAGTVAESVVDIASSVSSDC